GPSRSGRRRDSLVPVGGLVAWWWRAPSVLVKQGDGADGRACGTPDPEREADEREAAADDLMEVDEVLHVDHAEIAAGGVGPEVAVVGVAGVRRLDAEVADAAVVQPPDAFRADPGMVGEELGARVGAAPVVGVDQDDVAALDRRALPFGSRQFLGADPAL